MRSHTTQFCLSARRVTPAGALAADNLYMHHHLSTLICLCLFVFVAATTLTCPTRRRCPPPPAVRGAAHSMHGGTGQGAAVAGHPVLLTPISAPSPSISYCCALVALPLLWCLCFPLYTCLSNNSLFPHCVAPPLQACEAQAAARWSGVWPCGAGCHHGWSKLPPLAFLNAFCCPVY